MSNITARAGSKRVNVTASFLQCVTPGWVGWENPNFWFYLITEWIRLIYENDLWMNSFLVKLHDLNLYNFSKGAFQGSWPWNSEHFLTFLYHNCKNEELYQLKNNILSATVSIISTSIQPSVSTGSISI